MKKILLFIFIFSAIDNYAQKNTNDTIVGDIELGLTSYIVDFVYPAFDVDLIVPFYENGINSLAFKTSLFTYVRGNAVYSPTFVMFGSIFELQYRLVTKKGFVFTVETGLGIVGEFFTEEIYSEEKGFHNSSGVPYGMFSLGSRMGYDFSKKYKVPLQLTFVFSYRMQFPFNLEFNNLFLGGINLAYRFDTARGVKK